MFVKSVFDGAGPSPNSGNQVLSRAALSVTQPNGAAELPELAIAGSASGQALQSDHHTIDQHIQTLGRMRSAVEDAFDRKKAIEDLEALRAKILLGREDEAIEFALGLEDPESAPDEWQPPVIGIGAQRQEEREPGVKRHAEKAADPKNIISRIDEALDRIGKLKDKLNQDEAAAYEQLLMFNVSVNSLNVARTQASDSAYSVSAASAAVESIMTNLRTAVAAHGAASADVVRLVLAG